MAKKDAAAKEESSAAKEAEKKALDDYEKRLKEVLDLKAMTDTTAWENYWSSLQNRLKRHGVLILDAEKPREVVEHQMGVEVIRELMSLCRTPVDNLNAYIREMPLYSKQMQTRADFNDILGKVILSEQK